MPLADLATRFFADFGPALLVNHIPMNRKFAVFVPGRAMGTGEESARRRGGFAHERQGIPGGDTRTVASPPYETDIALRPRRSSR